ncbi:CopG family transcriptional regulator [Collimonas pratensis]|nr:CopG family transcriptional regulator [Collimonas pratensis]
MPTITIRLPADLKARVAAAAAHADITPHNFILSAIAERMAREERYGDFNAAAEQRYASMIASGQTIPWTEMRNYLEQRLAGKADAAKPTAKTGQ